MPQSAIALHPKNSLYIVYHEPALNPEPQTIIPRPNPKPGALNPKPKAVQQPAQDLNDMATPQQLGQVFFGFAKPRCLEFPGFVLLASVLFSAMALGVGLSFGCRVEFRV